MNGQWDVLHGRRYGEYERELELRNNRLPPANVLMPPELAATVRVTVLRPFFVGGGKRAQAGDVVEIPEWLARDVCAMGKAARI